VLGGVLCATASGGARTDDALSSLAASLVVAAAAARTLTDVNLVSCEWHEK
jgi:acetyl-CoA carboxylase beta subunit